MLLIIAFFGAGFAVGGAVAYFLLTRLLSSSFSLNYTRQRKEKFFSSSEKRPEELLNAVGEEDEQALWGRIQNYLLQLEKTARVMDGIFEKALEESKLASDDWAAAVINFVRFSEESIKKLQGTIGEITAGERTGTTALVDDVRKAVQRLIDVDKNLLQNFIEANTCFFGVMNNLKAKRLTGITSHVNGILRRTNLVAINAGIEAAKLGDLGKGISVIANEMRMLTGIVTDSIKSIEEMFKQIENELLGFSEKLNEGSEKVSRMLAETELLLQSYLTSLNERVTGIVSSLEGSQSDLEEVGNNLQKIISTLQYHDLSYQKLSTAREILKELIGEMEKTREFATEREFSEYVIKISESVKEKYNSQMERKLHEKVLGGSLVDDKQVGKKFDELGDNVELF